MRETTQVLVAGGGPAGTSAAALLGRQGFDVTLMEKSSFPRYHLGESLLPSLLPILDVLGAREAVDSHGFTRKTGPSTTGAARDGSFGSTHPAVRPTTASR